MDAWGVVDPAEGVELGWQLAEIVGPGSLDQPAFEGLVEAFDFALGLGVSGVPVFLGDPEAGEQVFEFVVAVGES